MGLGVRCSLIWSTMSREFDIRFLFAREIANGAGVADLDTHLGGMQREAPESKRCINELDGKGNRCFGSVLVVKESEEEPKPGEKRKKQKLWCPKCLSKKAEENKSAAGKETKATYRHAHREDIKEKAADYREDRREELARKERERKRNNPEMIKAEKDAWNATPQAAFSKMLAKFGINGLNGSFSKKAVMLGFRDADDLKKHFSDQFEEGMSFDNNGVQRVGGPPTWHIGHMIIPQCAYDRESKADQLRCFHKSNLAPQWASENLRQARKMASDEVLLKHRNLWPLAWGDELPSKELREKIENRRIDERFLHVHEDDIEAVLEEEEAEYESQDAAASGSD